MAKAEYENNQPFLPAEETDHLSDDDMATRVSLSDWKNQQQKELIKLVNSLPAGSISGLVGGQMDGSNVGYPAYDSADFRGTGMSSPDPKDVALWHSLYGDEPVSEGLSALEKQRLFNEGNKRIEAMTQQQLDAQTRAYARYASRGGAAERLHAAFKLEHPGLSDQAVAAAAQKLYAEGAWTLDQVNDLVAMGRTKEIVERVAMEAYMLDDSYGSSPSIDRDPYGFSDDQRTDVNFSGHRAQGSRAQPSQASLLSQFENLMDQRAKSSPNRERGILDGNDAIQEWKRKGGWY